MSVTSILNHLPFRPANESALEARAPTAQPDAWERLILICHAGVLGALVVASVLALGDGETSVSRRVLAVFLGVALTCWYVWSVGAGQLSHPSITRRAASLSVALLLAAALTLLHPAYVIVAWGLAWHVAIALPLRTASAILAAFAAFLALSGLAAGEDEIGVLLEVVLPFAVAASVFLFFAAIAHESRERKRLIQELETTREELAASERQAGVLQERQRLAGEIHDTLAQSFGSIAMQLEAAQASLAADRTIARERVTQAAQTARESLAEARRLVWALSPESLEQASLADAVKRVTDRWSTETGIEAKTQTVGDPRKRSPEMEVTLLRAAQEALNNVAKHAAATKVSVTLSYIDELTVLDVQDNGAGFDPADHAVAGLEGGFGLAALRDRVARLGGRLLIESTPGQGTTIVVELPDGLEPHE